jgi:hypothetical protein
MIPGQRYQDKGYKIGGKKITLEAWEEVHHHDEEQTRRIRIS